MSLLVPIAEAPEVDDRKLDVRLNRNCVCSSDSNVKVKVVKAVEIRLQFLWMTSAVFSSYGQGLFAHMVRPVRVLLHSTSFISFGPYECHSL
jgi:hypothetical protein